MHLSRSLSVGAILLLTAAAGAGPIMQRGQSMTVPAGQPCPPGTAQVRPGRCQAPEFPPPSIVDYRPRTTLVTAQRLVPKAKYPVIDIHGHGSQMIQSAEGLKGL